MGFIEGRYGDAPEEDVAPEGEYDLRIFSVEKRRSEGNPSEGKPARDMLQVAIAIEAPKDYVPINHFLVFPVEEDWEENGGRVAKMMLRGHRRFCHVFGVEVTDTGFDAEDLEGAMGRCFVTVEEYKGEDVNRLRLPRVK